MGAIAPFSLFSHTAPPANTAVRSVRVSACRLLVVTMLTEGPSSSGVVRRMGAPPRRFAHRIQHAGPAAALTYSWSPGHCCGCVHGGFHIHVIRQYEHGTAQVARRVAQDEAARATLVITRVRRLRMCVVCVSTPRPRGALLGECGLLLSLMWDVDAACSGRSHSATSPPLAPLSTGTESR